MARFRLSKVVLVCATIGLLAVFAPSAIVDYAHSANEQIRIYPASPRFSQPFFVAVSGQWADSCVPVYHSVNMNENVIQLEAKTPGPLVSCTDSETSWGFSVLIPPQLPGHYTGEVSVISGITGQTISFARHEFDVNGGIQVLPGQPIAGEDASLRLADLGPDGCVPQYVAHEVITQTVTIEAQIPDLICGQVPTPWQIDVSLGPLAVGLYHTEVFVTDYRLTPPNRTRLLDEKFVVVERLFQTYFPLWGCFGPDIPPLGCTIVQTPSNRGDAP